MSDQILEQISAFLDGELSSAETELLLKRLARDGELRASFGRYALIGEACRGAAGTGPSRGFAGRVSMAIAAEAPLAAAPARSRRPPLRLLRHAASGAVAAGVAVVAVFALQQRANTPTLADLSATPAAASQTHAAAKYHARPAALLARTDHEALSYTVPTTFSEAPAALPPARLTNYVFAHSQYSSLLGERSLLTGLIVEPADEVTDAAALPAAAPAPAGTASRSLAPARASSGASASAAGAPAPNGP
ncbi:MAG: sigma-E factor negative regulatory protein [Gammaproteobacteria bacterium]|nr:sigma-E factor negative regulatory protein [Gammaproteobacteria bacterium]